MSCATDASADATRLPRSERGSWLNNGECCQRASGYAAAETLQEFTKKGVSFTPVF